MDHLVGDQTYGQIRSDEDKQNDRNLVKAIFFTLVAQATSETGRQIERL